MLLYSVARVVKPHGVLGYLKVLPLKDSYSNFILKQKSFYINNILLSVEDIKSYKQGFILKLSVIDNMTEATKYRNYELAVEKNKLKTFLDKQKTILSEGLLDFVVYDDANNIIGKVDETIVTGSNDVIVVNSGTKEELLIPLIKDYILNIEENEKKIQIIVPQYDND
jgi:16S rRNA processing protein RimM